MYWKGKLYSEEDFEGSGGPEIMSYKEQRVNQMLEHVYNLYTTFGKHFSMLQTIYF